MFYYFMRSALAWAPFPSTIHKSKSSSHIVFCLRLGRFCDTGINASANFSPSVPVNVLNLRVCFVPARSDATLKEIYIALLRHPLRLPRIPTYLIRRCAGSCIFFHLHTLRDPCSLVESALFVQSFSATVVYDIRCKNIFSCRIRRRQQVSD